jgi:hypothetical protein
LTGCIRPVDPNATPAGTSVNSVVSNATLPTPAIIITSAPQATINAGATPVDINQQLLNSLNQYYFLGTGFALPVNGGTFNIWEQRAYNTDILSAFDFNNFSGLPCVGISAHRQDAFGNLQVYTAGYHCSTDLALPGVTGQWLIRLEASNSAVFVNAIRIVTPNVTGIGVEYQNGSAEFRTLTNGHLLEVRSDFVSMRQIALPDAAGNFIGQITVPMNPQG